MKSSWYTELSGEHYKLGCRWVPEREEGGITLYRVSSHHPHIAVQQLTAEQEAEFLQEEAALRYALAHAEWKGDEPDLIFTLYRDGKAAGVQREYFGYSTRVIKRYLYADYGGEAAARKAACQDDAFDRFVQQYS